MKILSVLLILVFSLLTNGQVTSSSASGRSDGKTPELAQSEARVSQLTAEVDDHFKKGLFYLQVNRLSSL